MSERKPIVLGDDGRFQQLQNSDYIDTEQDLLKLVLVEARLTNLLLQSTFNINADLDGLRSAINKELF